MNQYTFLITKITDPVYMSVTVLTFLDFTTFAKIQNTRIPLMLLRALRAQRFHRHDSLE